MREEIILARDVFMLEPAPVGFDSPLRQALRMADDHRTFGG
jgi:hypothetical protein